MEQAALLALANHYCAQATYTPPDFYYVTFANNNVEVSGITRKPFLYAAPVNSGSTDVLLSNGTGVVIDTPSSGTADEAWIMSAVTGGTRLARCPFDGPVTLTAGQSKTFDVGDLTHLWSNTTPAAP